MKESGDWSLPFRLIASDLSSAHLRYCNLECPISDRGRDNHHLYSFRADPRALEGLKPRGSTWCPKPITRLRLGS